jgi:arylsulfatase A-like enzyme
MTSNRIVSNGREAHGRSIAHGHSAVFAMLLLGCVASDGLAATPQKPNIVLILADDQRHDTIHALGNKEIQTPSLDRLANAGFHFTNAYCMGSMTPAVCLPSRTMLLTGRSVWRLPAVEGTKAPPDLVLLPRVLRDSGYVTFHCGKSSNSCRYGNAEFDINIETKKSGPDDMRHHGDHVLKFLREHDRKKPFFVYVAPPVPHDPRVAPERFVKMYDPGALTLSQNFMPEHPFDNGELIIRDEQLAPRPRKPEVMRQHLADYYASISDLDDQVGRILESLREQKYAENTVVIFTSDQGLAVGGRHGLMGKQNLYEHVKSPLIMSGPSIPHGKSDALVYLYDLFPTICDLARTETPELVEGMSLLPVMRGESDGREHLFTAYRDWQRMVRDRRWKLIEYHVGNAHHTQLFDLLEDPNELNNLADSDEQREILQRLRGELRGQARAFGDPVVFEPVRAVP